MNNLGGGGCHVFNLTKMLNQDDVYFQFYEYR